MLNIILCIYTPKTMHIAQDLIGLVRFVLVVVGGQGFEAAPLHVPALSS